MKSSALTPIPSAGSRLHPLLLVLLGVVASLLGRSFYNSTHLLQLSGSTSPHPCHHPLPYSLFSHEPPTLGDKAIANAAARLHEYLANRSKKDDIDSLIVAVGTSAGPLWWKGYGATRANESLPSPPPDLDTIYRLASMSKMFVTLDTLILRDRGLLSWDDPIDKYIPSFAYRPYGWSPADPKSDSSPVTRPPITFKQLASHLSGLGRDFPPLNLLNPISPVEEWNGTRPDLTYESVFEAIRSIPLVAPPWTYPIYSNTGFCVLGWANLAAAQLAASKDGLQGAQTFPELMKQDVFDPLGMDSSFFAVPPGFEGRLAVSSVEPEEADWNLSEAMYAAGGQASSARDLLKLMSQLLAPSENTIINPTTTDEWFRPIHVWNDGLSQTGAPWEILTLPSAGGGTFDLYTKAGNLAGFHTAFSVDRATGYGVVVLMTGKYMDATGIAATAAEKFFHPAFKSALAKATDKTYSGRYKSGTSEVVISVRDGALWTDKVVVNGTDFMKNIFEGYKVRPVALWPTGAKAEFRFALGRPPMNDAPHSGCEPYWFSIDANYANGAPLDLIYFEDNGDLTIPSLSITLSRQHKRCSNH